MYGIRNVITRSLDTKSLFSLYLSILQEQERLDAGGEIGTGSGDGNAKNATPAVSAPFFLSCCCDSRARIREGLAWE